MPLYHPNRSTEPLDGGADLHITIFDQVERWDRHTFSRIARSRNPLADHVLPRLTRWADHSALWVGIAVALAATQRRRARRAAGRGLGSVAVASLVANQIGKRIAIRERPSRAAVPLRRQARRIPTSSSFPSGHAASAAAFAAGVALEAPELAVPLGAVAAAVAYSRVYTGVHYPSDVLAGTAIGFGAAAAVARLVPLPSRPPTSGPAPTAAQPPRPTGAGVTAVVNPASGNGRGREVIAQLRAELPDATIVELTEGQNLVKLLRSVAPQAQVLAVSGGDGSLNAGAQVAMECNRPLMILPSGTLNHFAGDLGVADIAASVAAVQRGSAIRISTGQVRATTPDGSESVERCFINTASIGIYPAFVAIRERWQGRLGKPLASIVAAARVLRTHDPLSAVVDGRPRQVGLFFVGNNGYEPRGFAPNWRPSLAEGHLDVRLLDLSQATPRSRFAVAVLFGRVRQSHQYVECRPSALDISLAGPDRLSIDGEIVSIGTEVHFTARPSSLTVFRPDAGD